jgi:Mrp family chromosome partitioning ATPase
MEIGMKLEPGTLPDAGTLKRQLSRIQRLCHEIGGAADELAEETPAMIVTEAHLGPEGNWPRERTAGRAERARGRTKAAPAPTETDARAVGAETGRFSPLSDLARTADRFRPVKKLDRLTMPAIVGRVLDDCEDHWSRLAESLVHLSRDEGLRTLLVCSSLPGEGCTTVTLCLTAALARHGALRVCLVDGDFTRPGLNTALELGMSAGLEGVVLEDRTVDSAMVTVPAMRLTIVPLAAQPRDPGAALSSEVLPELLGLLADHHDLVLIDGGSMFAGDSAGVVTAGVDAAIIIRDPVTSGDVLLEQLDRRLADAGLSSLGVIENFAG